MGATSRAASSLEQLANEGLPSAVCSHEVLTEKQKEAAAVPSVTVRRRLRIRLRRRAERPKKSQGHWHTCTDLLAGHRPRKRQPAAARPSRSTRRHRRGQRAAAAHKRPARARRHRKPRGACTGRDRRAAAAAATARGRRAARCTRGTAADGRRRRRRRAGAGFAGDGDGVVSQFRGRAHGLATPSRRRLPAERRRRRADGLGPPRRTSSAARSDACGPGRRQDQGERRSDRLRRRRRWEGAQARRRRVSHVVIRLVGSEAALRCVRERRRSARRPVVDGASLRCGGACGGPWLLRRSYGSVRRPYAGRASGDGRERRHDGPEVLQRVGEEGTTEVLPDEVPSGAWSAEPVRRFPLRRVGGATRPLQEGLPGDGLSAGVRRFLLRRVGQGRTALSVYDAVPGDGHSSGVRR